MPAKGLREPVPQPLLNISDKRRSNLFAWRGQFSPQLVESLLTAYCPPDAVVLDPFAGSGTVLYEASRMGLSALGYEINPAAWSFSKLYEFANVPSPGRDAAISEIMAILEEAFPITLFSEDKIPLPAIEERLIYIGTSLTDRAKILLNALVCMLDLFRDHATTLAVHSKYAALAKLLHSLPYCNQPIKADLQDARHLPLASQSVDFALTSPPYINVFNYHQQYRRSAEVLGWDLLQVARSEIGSNRANRGNRFHTVIQYCIDMATALQEMARVICQGGRAIVILGHTSRVLGTPFFNADIVESIVCRAGMFDIVQRQQRVFTNRFGEAIREDILSLERVSQRNSILSVTELGRSVALAALTSALETVPTGNYSLLIDSIARINEISATPAFNSLSYADYQSRAQVMMVKEERTQL